MSDLPEEKGFIRSMIDKLRGFRHDSNKKKKHPHAGQPLPDPTIGTAPVIVEPGEPKPGDEYGGEYDGAKS